MLIQQDIDQKILKVIYGMENIGTPGFKESCPLSIVNMKTWEWAQGVGLYGLQKYYVQTKNPAMLKFLTGWFDENIQNGLPPKNVNTVCPMLTLTYVYEYTQDERYLTLIREWSQWVMLEMPRTDEGGIQHTTIEAENRQQMWADTLFMTVMFLARAGVLLGKQEYVDEAVRQFLLHIKYLSDRKTGLWFHGWSFARRDNFGDIHWARGNCWYTAGAVDFLDIPEDLNEGVKNFIIGTLLAQVEALEKYQEEDGMWHTIIDDPSSYSETSATAGFAYGILKAVRLGYIPEKFRKCGVRAMEAVMKNIDAAGIVGKVSYGTALSMNIDDYRNVPCCPMTYGQALAVLMLTEGMKT